MVLKPQDLLVLRKVAAHPGRRGTDPALGDPNLPIPLTMVQWASLAARRSRHPPLFDAGLNTRPSGTYIQRWLKHGWLSAPC